MRRLLPALLALFLGGMLNGCSLEKLIKVKGTVTNGTGSVPLGGGGMSVTFIAAAEEGKTGVRYPAEYNKETGAFEVLGPDKRGIPPGKYRVAILIKSMTMTPAFEDINTRFGPSSSPIEVEVNDEQPLKIDLSKY